MSAEITTEPRFEQRVVFDSGGRAVLSRNGRGYISVEFYGGGRFDHTERYSAEDVRKMMAFVDETDGAALTPSAS